VLEAALWGFVGGLALLAGAIAGLVWDVPRRVIGLVMAFGAGVLISALSFELTAEAVRSGGFDAAADGLAAGSLSSSSATARWTGWVARTASASAARGRTRRHSAR
jgi:ZIP family zinc transporter